ncbi:MAG TPA: hypothetical protein ENG81_01555 [Candidatus Bathyarchaeota archaeon]|nr:hypothetical protein [Candidatus Bathyarchaeota archaeon]
MTYKLAKQLKEAGFPQYDNEQRQIDNYTELRESGLDCEQATKEAEVCYIPELEELIDACGKEMDCLERLGRGWHVWNGRLDKKEIAVKGKTPLEAVAKLYIKLNT